MMALPPAISSRTIAVAVVAVLGPTAAAAQVAPPTTAADDDGEIDLGFGIDWTNGPTFGSGLLAA